MSKVDFTKPLQYGEAKVHFVGLSIGGRPVIQRQGKYVPFIIPDGKAAWLKNAPVTHKRWVVLYSYTTDDKVFSNTLTRVPTADDLKLYHKVIAIKEVTIEEGEGL